MATNRATLALRHNSAPARALAPRRRPPGTSIQRKPQFYDEEKEDDEGNCIVCDTKVRSRKGRPTPPLRCADFGGCGLFVTTGHFFLCHVTQIADFRQSLHRIDRP